MIVGLSSCTQFSLYKKIKVETGSSNITEKNVNKEAKEYLTTTRQMTLKQHYITTSHSILGQEAKLIYISANKWGKGKREKGKVPIKAYNDTYKVITS